MMLNLTAPFGDRAQSTLQTIPVNNAYVIVNADDSDRIMIDPAYRLEKYTASINALKRLSAVEDRVSQQLDPQRVRNKVHYDREMYETWFQVEKSIRKMDRLFNKVEKFEGRRFSDPDNFKRREARMLERKRERESKNFTYFFGGLTEEEQMYRDYYETDIENDPESEAIEDQIDEDHILATGDFNHKRFDFVAQDLLHESHEDMQDLVEDKIFKFKYRKANDYGELYQKRQRRVLERFLQRLEHRDPSIEENVADLHKRSELMNSNAALLLGEADIVPQAHTSTRALRDYMA